MTATFIDTNTIGAGVQFTFVAAGDNLTILEGVTLASTTGDAIDAAGFSDLTLTVLGTVVSQTELNFSVDRTSIHIGATGRLVINEPEAGNTGLFFNGTGNRLVNDGEIIASRAIGLLSFGASDLANNGSITAASGVFLGLDFASGDRFINSGTVTANAFRTIASAGFRFNNGVYAEGGSTLITNLAGGVISASDATGAGVRLGLAAGNSLVQNWGEIVSLQDYGVNFAEIFSGQSAARLFNWGSITGQDGAFLGSVNEDRVINRGVMNGLVGTGDGADIFDNRLGTVNGEVQMGGGIDEVFNSLGTVNGDVLMGDQGDGFRNNGGRVNGSWFGGSGDDLYFSIGSAVVEGGIIGDDGNDSLVGADTADDMYGGLDNDTLVGFGGDDTLRGEDGNDQLDGRAGEDLLFGDANSDRLFGGHDADSLFGGTGNDLLNGGAGNDSVEGGDNNDILHGIDGDDVLIGGLGADTINGGTGNDTILGGSGRDTLFGGAGEDVFRFVALADSPIGADIDVIRDFQAGLDDIDFTLLPVALTYVGSAAHTGGGTASVRFTSTPTVTAVLVDTNGDGTSDMRILLTGSQALTAGDFLL